MPAVISRDRRRSISARAARTFACLTTPTWCIAWAVRAVSSCRCSRTTRLFAESSESCSAAMSALTITPVSSGSSPPTHQQTF